MTIKCPYCGSELVLYRVFVPILENIKKTKGEPYEFMISGVCRMCHNTFERMENGEEELA